MKNYENICSKCGKEFTITRDAYNKRIRNNNSLDICSHCLLSKDEIDKISNKIYDYNCSVCGNKFTITRQNYIQRKRNNRSINICSNCLRSISSINMHKTMSEDKKREKSNNISNALRNMPEYKKIEKNKKISITAINREKNMSEDKRKKRSEKLSKLAINQWKFMSENKKREKNNKFSLSIKSYYDNLSNNIWILNQCNIAKSISDIHNDINFIQEDPLLIELETRLTKLGYIFIREYPTFILLDKECKIDIPIEILYCKDVENVLKYQIKDSNNNPRPGFRKNWDYLITIPFSDKRLFLDIDGNVHDIILNIPNKYLNKRYLNNRFNTNDIEDVNKYYDNRRESINCDKILYKINNNNNSDKINSLIYKIIEYFKN